MRVEFIPILDKICSRFLIMKKQFFMFLLAFVLVLAPSVAFAADTTPVDTLKTETGKLTGVYDAVVPLAIGSSVFSIGMLLLKRVAFA